MTGGAATATGAASPTCAMLATIPITTIAATISPVFTGSSSPPHRGSLLLLRSHAAPHRGLETGCHLDDGPPTAMTHLCPPFPRQFAGRFRVWSGARMVSVRDASVQSGLHRAERGMTAPELAPIGPLLRRLRT